MDARLGILSWLIRPSFDALTQWDAAIQSRKTVCGQRRVVRSKENYVRVG